MQCEKYREQMQRFLDGELSGQESESLAGHCMTCAACSAYLHRLSAVQVMVRKSKLEEPPTDLHEKIMETIRQEKRKRKTFMFSCAAAAVILLVVGGTVNLRNLGYFGAGDAVYEANVMMDGLGSAATEAYVQNDAAAVDNTAPLTEAAIAAETKAAANVNNPNAIAETTAADQTTAAQTESAEASEGAENQTLSLLHNAWVVEETYSETLDEETLETVREALGDWTERETLCTEAAAFVDVIRLETVPQGVQWLEQFQGQLGVEDVSILACRMTAAEIDALLENTLPDWHYRTNDSAYFDALALDVAQEQGLLLVVIPAGA